MPRRVRQARDIIDAYAVQHDEDKDEVWHLFYAYCRYGSIGLLDALPVDTVPLMPEELQTCALFHRLGKHPRSDVGIYIRQLLSTYANDLGYALLPPFLARYAFAQERKLEHWYLPEGDATEHVTKTTRRLNLQQDYPHRHGAIARTL